MTADPWLTAAQLSNLFGVPVGTIYRWASEDNWPRTSRRHRPVRYDSTAAEASMTRRQRPDLALTSGEAYAV